MALSTLQRFRIVAPEFSGTSDDDVNDAIEMATERIDVVVFGDDYQQALAYLAAHILSTAGKTGNAPGPVISERAGELQRSYGYSQTSDGLEASSYGKEFLALRRARHGTHTLTTSQDLGLE